MSELDQSKAEAAIRAVVRRATISRRTPLAFFDFAWREETTQKRVRALPHQRLFFKFIEAHPLCVVRMPPGFSKTTCSIVTGLFLLGSDPTSRGAFISATESQAQKPVSQMRDCIEYMDESFPEIRLTFPDLRNSTRENDPWSKSSFTVHRPPGIRDASVTAFGLDSVKIVGSRLSWIVVDDILSIANTMSKESRDAMAQWFLQVVRDRLDTIDGRCVVTNVPHDPDDLTYYLEEKEGWPCLTMDAFGGVKITNTGTDDWVGPDEARPVDKECWDCDDIRPSAKVDKQQRLAAHDAEEFGAPLAVRNPASFWQWAAVGTKEAELWESQGGEKRYMDLAEEIPLWPSKFSVRFLEAKEGASDMSKAAFATNYKMQPRTVGDQRCDPEWIKECKARARLVGHTQQATEWTPRQGAFTVMGVDIGGFGQAKTSDWSCFFVYECFTEQHHIGTLVLPAGTRRILRVRYGRWKPKEFVNELVKTAEAFNAVVRVEKNAEEAVPAWINEVNSRVMVRSHHTGNNKHHVTFGVEGGVFLAMEKGRWLIPNDANGRCEPDVEKWCRECLDYRPFPAHTPDGVMAAWIATEEERAQWQLVAA